MFHGRKKQAGGPIVVSAEEQKQNDAKLAMILQINKAILAKRAKHEYDDASLAQTEKFSQLSPDFITLWNYRKEILAHMLKEESMTN